jgi:hypothetical protein
VEIAAGKGDKIHWLEAQETVVIVIDLHSRDAGVDNGMSPALKRRMR